MKEVVRVFGKDIGVEAYRIEGYEKHGLVYLADREGDACGAQCANCHSILWTSIRKNSILNEKRPDSVPISGPGYSDYFYQKIKRFLDSLPECPECKKKHYDVFFTNSVFFGDMVFSRFEDGYSYPNDNLNTKITNIDVSDVLFWWYIEGDN